VREAVAKLAPDAPGEDAAWLWFSLSLDRSAGVRANVAAAERALALFETLQDRQGAGRAAAVAAFRLEHAGDTAGAKDFAEAARAILQTSPPNLHKAITLDNLASARAIAARDATDSAAARRDYAAALEILETFNDRAGMLSVSGNLAEIQARLGDYAGAIENARRNVAEGRTRRDWRNLTYDLVNLTSYCLLVGDDAAAAQAAREAVPLVAELDDQQAGAAFTGGLALLAARAGALETAAKLAGHTNQYYLSAQELMLTIEQRVWDALMALFTEAETTGKLPPETTDHHLAAGATLSLQDALKLPLPF
jgi:hypothetical protein